MSTLIGMIQYIWFMILYCEPSQSIKSSAKVPFCIYISILYFEMTSEFALGAWNAIFTPPVKVSIDVVTVFIYDGAAEDLI